MTTFTTDKILDANLEVLRADLGFKTKGEVIKAAISFLKLSTKYMNEDKKLIVSNMNETSSVEVNFSRK